MSVRAEEAEQEVFSFQAEAVQILDLMVHSLYSNKEIFLRELVSNASDAIDRLRLELLSRSELPQAEGPLRIRVSYDKDTRTITIADNGIGMSRDEVIANIGTIAKSGTQEFLRSLTGDQRKDAAMIGQFGVGFYSSFIVADRVVLTTRRAGLEQGQGVRWESDGRGEYTLETIERLDRGTTIVLQLREDEDDLLNGWRLRSIIEKYSDHVSVPILMPGEPEDKAEEEASEPKPDITVNRASALWTRPKSELADKDYNDFYQHIAGEFSDPLAWVHARIEGTYEYTLLLFIPSSAPYDLWVETARRGVRLHVQRVFIMEDTGQILPKYLRFIRGVIDSSDLPLNVSREILQGSRAVDNIRVNAVKKVLRRLTALADSEPEKYATFWKEFGVTLKEGIADDYSNRDEIAKLLRFTSTKSATDDPDTSLDAYVARMKDGQEDIYYLLAPSLAAAKSSPHLEAFRTKGVEVLLLSQGVDNWVVSSLREFDGKKLQSVAQGNGDLGALADEEEKQAKEQADTEYAELLGKLKAYLAGQAWDVRLSTRLTTSPACIVSNEPEIDVNLMQRLRGTGLPRQAVLELNPQHPLIQRLNDRRDDRHLGEWAQVLFNQAVLTLGARIEDPTTFVQRLNSLLTALTAEEAAETREDSATEEPTRADDQAVADAPPEKDGTDHGEARLSANPPARLFAVSDLHITFPANREFVASLPAFPHDWLLVAGDVAEKAADIEWALRALRARFATVVWVPGNHELWSLSTDPVQLRGEARYQYLVAMCRRLGVITPEDPFPVWEGAGGPLTIVPLFVLYDYSFRPDGTTTKDEALALAYETGIVCSDEAVLYPDPYPSRDAWCRARLEVTERRLAELSPGTRTALVSHFPLTREPTRVLRYQEFAQWCGTEGTADWHVRFGARVVVYGHLHIPGITWQDGVRFEEVSFGYPQELELKPDRPRGLRQILPAEPEPYAAGTAIVVTKSP